MSDQGDTMDRNTVTSEDGRTWVLEPCLVAYQGKKGCTDVRCTRSSQDESQCFGYHCPVCDAPCSMVGHASCREQIAPADHGPDEAQEQRSVGDTDPGATAPGRR